MNKAFWVGRRLGWVVVGLTLAIVGLTVWLLRAKSGVNIATVLALTVSIASLATAVWGLWPRPSLGSVAKELANRVAQERGRARRQALGTPGDAPRADVGFRAPLTQAEPELVRWRSDGGPECGTLRNIAEFYRSLDRGRLVVLGEPGAGKTVLATQLVIDLIGGMPKGELEPGAQPQVPVWLSLTSLDLGDTGSLARMSAEEIAARLDQWIATQMSTVYQVSRPIAERLIRGRWVLPIFDGLDEMDPPDRGAYSSVRPRAAAIVRALNAGTGQRPAVLVCRRAEYRQMARSASVGGEDPVLQDASQIVLEPLDIPAICDYLTKCFPGGQLGTIAPRWKNVQTTLNACAELGRDTGLAEVLSSPWRLFLAVTAYQHDASDPDELIRRPASTVAEHLLAQLIPALTSLTPRPGGGHYPPSEVSVWFSTFARHLDHTSSDPKLHWSATDLRLERLWLIGGQKTARWLSALVSSVLLGTALIIFGLWWVHVNRRWYPDTPGTWLGFIAAISFIAYSSFQLIIDADPTLNRLDLRLATPTRRRKIVVSVMAGLVVGLAGGLAGGLTLKQVGGLSAGLSVGLSAGLSVGLSVGLSAGLEGNFSVAAQPTSIMRQNITYGLVVGLVVGLSTGLVVGLSTGLVLGLVFGLSAGLSVGLVLALAIWIRYVIGCWLARRKGMLPRRVGQFLDWAYRASLLRMSGTAVQFRHREFQDWLASRFTPTVAPKRPRKHG